MLCLTVFGCTGNILTLIVVNQRFFRKTTLAAFISVLSIADCLVLCLQSLQIVTKLHPQVTSYDCFVFFLMDVFRLLSIWLVCFISIERCSLVFNPCHMPRLRSRTKSRLCIAILFAVAILIFSHYARHMHIEYLYVNNQTTPVRSFCAFKRNFHRLTWQYIRSSLTYWLTIPLCTICNAIIILRFRQASRIERALNSHLDNHLNLQSNKLDLSSKQRQMTAMLVTSSICFILTATPSAIHTIYILNTRKMNNSHYIVHILTNILLHFHHASNFLAFIFSCARFRTELLHLFRRYFHCQIYKSWQRRSGPNTEQNLADPPRHRRAPTKLLVTPQTKKPQRTVKSSSHPGIALLATNHDRRGHVGT